MTYFNTFICFGESYFFADTKTDRLGSHVLSAIAFLLSTTFFVSHLQSFPSLPRAVFGFCYSNTNANKERSVSYKLIQQGTSICCSLATQAIAWGNAWTEDCSPSCDTSNVGLLPRSTFSRVLYLANASANQCSLIINVLSEESNVQGESYRYAPPSFDTHTPMYQGPGQLRRGPSIVVSHASYHSKVTLLRSQVRIKILAGIF